jgi:Fe-S oxidoreductase
MSREDWLFVSLMFIAGIGGFLVEAFRIQATQPDFERISFAGWAISRVVGASGVSPEEAQSAFAYIWVVHAMSALLLIGWIPFSKAWHMVAGWYTVAIQPDQLGVLKASNGQDVGAGYETIADLSRGELATLDACIRCGRCHVLCPAASTGFPLSPRDLILALRASSDQRSKTGKSATNGDGAVSLAGDVIPTSWIWSCTSCLVCDEICPLGIEHLPFIIEMRRQQVSQGAIDEGVQETLMNATRYGNSFGKSERARAKWIRGLDFKPKDARREPVEYLWFLGDYASFDPRMAESTRATARVLQAAGVDFGILYEGERNSGNDMRRIGEEGLFELLREKNMQSLERAQFDKIITTDPHTYHVFRHEYETEDTVLAGKPILHYTELLARLLKQGKLEVHSESAEVVTYHDPCFLGRYNGIYEQPRNILKAVGARIVEMPRNRAQSFCCGAGGGRIWMEDVEGIEERPAESRVREAAGLQGVTKLVVSCPKDMVMFQDALKSTGLEDQLMVCDIISLVEAAIGQEHKSEAHEQPQS